MNKTSVILTAVLAAILVVGAFIGGWFAGKGRRQVISQRDTVTTVITIRDTITQYQPKYITKEVIRKELVEVTDTVTINDTTYIALPFERREYADSNYRAVVTGFCPELESISVYPKTQIVTQTITQTIEKKPTRFGVGVQVGFGASYGLVGKKVDSGPYIGVGVSYNFLRF